LKVLIQLVATLDQSHLEAQALRRGRSVEAIVAEIAGDCECRAHDSIKWRDGVERVATSVALESTTRSS
jgi:hypothetical protein